MPTETPVDSPAGMAVWKARAIAAEEELARVRAENAKLRGKLMDDGVRQREAVSGWHARPKATAG